MQRLYVKKLLLVLAIMGVCSFSAADLSSKAQAVSAAVLQIYQDLQKEPCTLLRYSHWGHGPVCPAGHCVFKFPPQAYTGKELSNLRAKILNGHHEALLNQAIVLGNYLNEMQDPTIALDSLNASLVAIVLLQAFKDGNQSCARFTSYLTHELITPAQFYDYTTQDLVAIENTLLEGLQLLTRDEETAARDYFGGTVSLNPLHVALAAHLAIKIATSVPVNKIVAPAHTLLGSLVKLQDRLKKDK